MMYAKGAELVGQCFNRGAGMMNGYGYSSGGHFMMMGAGLLVLALIVVAVVVIVKKSSKKSASAEMDGSLELLNDRFVKGEITEEEYTRMKKVLKGK